MSQSKISTYGGFLNQPDMKHFLHTTLLIYFLACSFSVFARTRTAPPADTPSVRQVRSVFQNGSPVFSNEKITVSGVFPNPAFATATLEYEITGEMKETKFTLSNVLGSAVAEYKLSRESRKLQFAVTDFAPGIYFYTLSADGKSLFTRKLIIRHPS